MEWLFVLYCVVGSFSAAVLIVTTYWLVHDAYFGDGGDG